MNIANIVHGFQPYCNLTPSTITESLILRWPPVNLLITKRIDHVYYSRFKDTHHLTTFPTSHLGTNLKIFASYAAGMQASLT